MPKLIFIVSLPRSGSTLLQRLLMEYQEVSSVSEPWLMIPLAHMRDSGEGDIIATYDHHHVNTAINDLINSMEGGIDKWNNCLRSFTDCIYGSTMPDSKQFFIDKTPRNLLVLPFIEKIYPDAKFIFLYRQPLAIMSSIVRTWNEGKFMPDYQNKIDLHEGPEMMVEGWERLKHKSIKISYEDLVKDTGTTLDTVCMYLGLKTKLNNTIESAHLRGVMGDKTGIEKYKKVSVASLNDWVQVFDSWYRRKYALNYLNQLGDDLIQRMGYSKNNIIKELSSHGFLLKPGIMDYINTLRVRIYHAATGKFARKVLHKILVPGNLFK